MISTTVHMDSRTGRSGPGCPSTQGNEREGPDRRAKDQEA